MDGKSEESSEVIGNQDLESAFAAFGRTDMIHPLAVQHSVADKVSKSNSSAIKNGFEDFLRFKKFAGESTSSTRMIGVVRINYFHGIDNFVQGSKR